MRINRYSRTARAILFMMTGVVLLGGCNKDVVERTPGTHSDGALTLNISLPAPVPRDMTRAVDPRYNTIENLNIIIATGNGDADTITHIFYLDAFSEDAVEALFPQSGVTYSSLAGGGHGIHFSELWAELYDISSKDCAFFLISNWGNPIDEDDTDRISVDDTVEQLRAVKVERRREAMFGESVDLTPGHAGPGGEPHPDGRTLKIELKRMVAMITVAIDGTHLDEGVEIIPTSIRLHNVPAWGTFGKNNVLTTEEGGIIPLEGAILTNGYELTDFTGWPDVIKTGVIGGNHYENGNWDTENIRQLFMYENYHGDNFGEDITPAQQAYKRPRSTISGVSYSTTPTKAEIAAVTGACTYLQVEARYRDTGQSGTVAYRLFLGGDILQDFNVMRNTYYKVTLDLSGGAIAESDYSWRMDANLGALEIIGESDIIVNGGGESVLLQVAMLEAKNGNAQFGIEFDSGDGSFAWINMGDTSGENSSWMALNGDRDKDKFPSYQAAQGYNFQFWFFIKPMIPGVDGVAPDARMRRVRFRLVGETNTDEVTEWITITQYASIAVTIESDYSALEDTTQRAKMQAIRDFAADTLGWTLPRTFYLDRVDNNAEPWGFDNLNIPAPDPDNRRPSGWDNGNYLLGNALAANYLPYGEGSAMMRAAFMPYYQRATPAGIPNPSSLDIGDIRGGASAAGYPQQFFIPSVNEWRLIDMLFEAGVEVEDEMLSPIIWNDYWTSDALPGSSSDSYTYRMGHPEEEIGAKETFPRATPSASYRMMYF